MDLNFIKGKNFKKKIKDNFLLHYLYLKIQLELKIISKKF